MAALPEFRRHLLHLSAPARCEGAAGICDPHRAASALLLRPDRHSADRRARADPQLVADGVLLRVQVPGGRSHPHLPSRRAVRANHRDPGGGALRARADDRRGSGRTRAAGPPHLCQPAKSRQGHGVAVIDRYGVRRHLPASPPRGKRESAAGLIAIEPTRDEAGARSFPDRAPDVILTPSRGSVPTIVAVMVVVMVMMVW